METENALKPEFLISEDKYVRAAKLYGAPTRKQWIYNVLGLVILIVVAIFGHFELIRFAAGCGIVAGVLGYLAATFYLIPSQARRQYRTTPAAKVPFGIALVEEGIRINQPDSDALLKWEYLFKWRENEEFILLYQSNRLYSIIPKRFAAGGLDIAGLILKLQEKVGPVA